MLTKPLKRGNADIDAAPTIQKIHVKGMVLYNPPKSVALIFPVRYITAPIDIKRRDLYNMCAKACAAVPFIDNSVPIPIPTTINPT